MKTGNSTIGLFDKYAKEYDDLQDAIVPHYNDIIQTVADAYMRYVGEGTFLDLGCGTGNVTLKVLEGSPRSRAFMLDGSPSMLDVGLAKVKERAGGEAVLGSKAVNVENADWSDSIEGPFDAIVTAFVLEHLREDDYRAVVKKGSELLKPGGVFISVEWSDDEFGMQQWFISRMQQQGEAYPQYKHIIDEAKDMERHYFVNIHDKIHWLEQAGFRDVHTIWQYLFGYIVVSKKAG